jgi:hypothetical protein
MTHIEVSGLLVGASAWGMENLRARLDNDWVGAIDGERQLASQPALANLGKQLLLRART